MTKIEYSKKELDFIDLVISKFAKDVEHHSDDETDTEEHKILELNK